MYLTDLNYGECDEREEEVKSCVFKRNETGKAFQEEITQLF